MAQVGPVTPTPARITERFRVEELPGQSRGGRQLFKICEPLEYRVGSAESAEVIVVPMGFVTDFASIPWGVRDLFPPIGLHGRPAILHDFLYRISGQTPDALNRLQAPAPGQSAEGTPMLDAREITAWLNLTSARPEINARAYVRAEADAIFREAMEVVGVSAWRRTVMYRAVRMGGKGGWGR